MLRRKISSLGFSGIIWQEEGCSEKTSLDVVYQKLGDSFSMLATSNLAYPRTLVWLALWSIAYSFGICIKLEFLSSFCYYS
jgi:hypothetical protein